MIGGEAMLKIRPMRLLVLSGALLSLVGCISAQLIMAPGGDGSAYAPVNEAMRPGLIRYVWSEDRETEHERRMEAYERMWAACGGKYRLLDEEARTEPTGLLTTPNGNGHVTTITYWYIEFECVRE